MINYLRSQNRERPYAIAGFISRKLNYVIIFCNQFFLKKINLD